jgi:hypothetical protein
MAILNGAHRGRGLALLLFLGVGGCVVFDAFGGGPRPLAFSHKIHVGDEGLDCADCHRGAATQDDPGMPVLQQCLLCHEELDASKPPERKVTTLFAGKDYKAARASRLAEEVQFSHGRHVAAGTACAACHAGIEQNERIDRGVAVTMDACMVCHAHRGVANECETCHRELDVDVAPATHAHHWLRVHGKAVRADTGATSDRCELCHSPSRCTSCHFETPPSSHTNHFRRRGHGLIARMDRDSCATCHRPDSCDRCHRETRPMNHGPSWGATRNNHCLGCHTPLRATECSTCHKGTPSHGLAAPLPPGHNAGMNCRQCHGLVAPLPHVDNGDECISCHR